MIGPEKALGDTARRALALRTETIARSETRDAARGLATSDLRMPDLASVVARVLATTERTAPAASRKPRGLQMEMS